MNERERRIYKDIAVELQEILEILETVGFRQDWDFGYQHATTDALLNTALAIYLHRHPR